MANNTIRTARETMPEFVKLLRRVSGATSEQLRIAMNRKWGPTQYQLQPIADRMGFRLTSAPGSDGRLRYRFETKAARSAVPAKAVAAKAAAVKAAPAKTRVVVTAKKPAKRSTARAA